MEILPVDMIKDSFSQSMLAGGLARTTHRIWRWNDWLEGYDDDKDDMMMIKTLWWWYDDDMITIWYDRHEVSLYLIILIKTCILADWGIYPCDPNWGWATIDNRSLIKEIIWATIYNPSLIKEIIWAPIDNSSVI